MKFMEKAKRFFTLSAKREGFTLVELIVVIAILAILAGVAVPAYSGYINKSKRASDDTLLNAVNKAFASSLSANGSDIYEIKDAKLKIEGKEVKGIVSITPYTGAVNTDKVAESFELFYLDANVGAKFEVIEPVFDPYKYMFVARGEETGMSVPFGKGDYVIALKNIEAFKGSVFAKDVDAMQDQLSSISGAFSDVIGTADTAGSISPEFKAFMDANGYGDKDLGNAAVLYVAKNAGDFTAQDVAQMFADCGTYINNTGDQTLGGIMSNAFTDTGKDGLTSIALMYGAVTAYANSDYCKDDSLKTTVKDVNNASALVSVFMGLNGDTNFENYVGSMKQDGSGNVNVNEDFANDLNGFMGAMDALNTVAPDVKTDDTDFWAGEEVDNLLGELLK